MNKLIIVILCLLFVVTLSSCGTMEIIYDEANYESLSNETGTVIMFSGGEEIAEYKNATIIYSSTDTQALWIKTVDGRTIYLQGDIIIELAP